MSKPMVLSAAVLAAGLSVVTAQTSILTDRIQLLQPGLTVSVFEEFGSPLPCAGSSVPIAFTGFFCEDIISTAFIPGHGTDAQGSFYGITRLVPPNDGVRVERKSAGGIIEAIAFIPSCLQISSGPAVFQVIQTHNLFVDPSRGALYIAVTSRLRNFGVTPLP